MNDDELREKKARYKKTISEMTKHAEEKFSLGVKYSIISQKLLKTVRAAGFDLSALLQEMNKDGEIFLYTDADYSRLVMVPEMKEHYRLGIIGEETEETRNFISAKWGRKPKGSRGQ